MKPAGRKSLVLVLVMLFCGSTAVAQKLNAIRYRAKKGDTLDLLAAEFYGNRDHAIFIMKVNGLTHKRDIRPKEPLKIPVPVAITTQEGDTWEGLAEKYLGDARRARHLADFNKGNVGVTLAAGRSLTIPFHVTHTAERPVDLRDIALAYTRRAGKARLLREYNFLEKNRLEKGESVVVPIEHVELHASKRPALDDKSSDLIDKRSKAQRVAREALPQAEAAWKTGDYDTVKSILTDPDIRLAFLDAELATKLGVLLGSSFVAFEETDLALNYFTKVLERAPEYTLSRYHHSPKVRRVWEKAGGKVVGSE